MSDTGNKDNRRSGDSRNQRNKPSNKKSGGKRYYRGGKRHSSSQNRNRRPKSLTPSRILQKYDNLLEQYLIARRKFFELFGRANPKQLGKADQNYKMALEALRKFEANLKEDWQIEVLKQKINSNPEDRQFTSEHNLEPKGDEVSFVGEFEDPHLLDTQKSHSWAEDSDETSGSMEDYYAYKGISPPTTTN